ncbi:MAG: hypothetical protein E8D40_08475 [Nitrospira sp.]|nr:MAG: hypothetical protein E8D40_08475 [Nitrospira sp.]
MNRKWNCSIALLVVGISLPGCETNDRLLFATKTSYGLDIDSKPPTAEVTIARRELAVVPTFRDVRGERNSDQNAAKTHNTLPLLASFGLEGTFFDPTITSRFAGGEAAVILAEGPDNEHKDLAPSTLCLSKEPDLRPFWKWAWQTLTFQKDESSRDFYFATDTSFGLKAAWDGSTGPYPSTVKLGYNRKELAFPPIFAQEVLKKECSDKADSTDTKEWKVTLPSFVASLDNSSVISTKEQSGVNHVQFFATGKAASEFVKRREVNSVLNKALYPQNDFLIMPESVAMTVESTRTFEVAGGKGQVRFTLMHDTATAGSIDPSTGIYTAGKTPGTYSVGASDKTGRAAIATITVYPTLDITPKGQSVAQGQTLQFSAIGGVPPFTFTISDNKSGGAIDQRGLYTAGNTGNMTDKVKITDSSLPPISVETTVHVQ